jgi:TonB-dependent receptor
MQKGLFNHPSVRFIMKVSFLIWAAQLTFLSVLLASDVKGQNINTTQISLNLNHASIKESLLSIEKSSDIHFSIQDETLNAIAKKVTIKTDAITIKQAIDLVLDNTGLQYKIINNFVVISKKYIPPPPPPPGSIKGRIVEFETSQPLPGATVRILELSGKGGASDINGYYNLTNIPPGKYTIQVSFIGFKPENIQVEVKEGKESTYDVKLQGDNKLNEVVVKGTKKTRAPVSHTTERQLVQELKAAQSVVSGISSEQISKGADRNAAEVVRKIAGVTVRDDKFIVIRGMNERYNLTYLNGNIAPSTELYSRAFSLDLIPSRIIDRILVYKSPAPDLLGDMTGGAVKIFTKDAKEVNHFDIEFQTGIRENTTFNNNFLTYQGGKYDFLGFDDGIRKLPSTVPGYGNFNKANISQATYASSFSNILNYGQETAAPPVQLTANYYTTYKLLGKDLSMLTSFSYKNEPLHEDIDRLQGATTTFSSKMGTEDQNTQTAQLSLLQNFTYHLRDSSTLYFKNFLLNQGQSATYLQNYTTFIVHQNGSWQPGAGSSSENLRNIILSWSQRFLYSGNVGGNHYFGENGKSNLQWNGGYTYSRLSIPDQRAIHLQQLNPLAGTPYPGISVAGDGDQNWLPVFRDLQSNNNLEYGMISRTWTQNTEANYNGSADYTYKLLPWVTLKAGTYQQWKAREVYRRIYTVNEGDIPASGYPDPFNPGIGATNPNMDYNLVFWHQQDLNNVWSNKYLRDDGSGLKVFDRTDGSGSYTASEQNNSGYIAASLLPFNGKLDIYGGLRVEYDRQRVAAAIPGDPGDINVPILVDLHATSYLPSVNIGYRPTNSLVFRAAYGKTVNRPEFREISPYSELDYVSDQTITGNPNLVSATADNYDLRAEWYPRANAKGEMISIGAFEKRIIHPIERVLYNVSDPNVGPQPTQISYQNADRASVKGVELDIRKNLDFIPGQVFRNLSVIANGSWIYSKVDSVGGGIGADTKNASRQLQGQVPYIINVGLYYDNAGSGTKIAAIFNQTGPDIYAAAVGPKALGSGQVGASSYQSSLLELTRRQFDFSLTQRIIKSLQAKFSIQNILNNTVQLAEDDNFTYKYEKAVFVVAPVKPGQTIYDTVKGDPIYSSYKPGRFFLFTLTYGF